MNTNFAPKTSLSLLTIALLSIAVSGCGPGQVDVPDPDQAQPGQFAGPDELGDVDRDLKAGPGELTLMSSCPNEGSQQPTTPNFASTIESYTGYVGQSKCSGSAGRGVSAFRDTVLATFTCTGDFGIMRACSSGGKSEHKEGRAWDWKLKNPRPAADALIKWLLASDKHGNRHAMARRLGIMYMIYNRKIWKAYQSDRGWQRYTGSNAHTDHIHFSFSWAGARKETTFWTARLAGKGDSGGNGGTNNGGGNTTPTSCFYGGIRGTCQATNAACTGTKRSGLGCASGNQCCLPPPSPTTPPPSSYGTCNYGGQNGVCQSTSTSCSGSYRSGLCPGNTSIKCCLPPKPSAPPVPPTSNWGSCSYSGQKGVCQSTSSSCSGSYRAGLCPGNSTIKCCLPPTSSTSSWGKCSYGGKSGVCQSTSNSCSGGSYRSGLCPGNNTIKCCLR